MVVEAETYMHPHTFYGGRICFNTELFLGTLAPRNTLFKPHMNGGAIKEEWRGRRAEFCVPLFLSGKYLIKNTAGGLIYG